MPRPRPRPKTAPDPGLQSLFEAMADEAPGLLRMVRVQSRGKAVRLRLVKEAPFGKSSYVREFVVYAGGPPGATVTVRTKGGPDVLVSPVPSAVLAVALR